ncbi:MAG: 50S ribosomal protein L17 [Actinomycetes bacterium]|jgi:large subunit ribosomal protein L17|nr:50S ribosomal protein L17 [Actinomycetes bacterium]
MRHAKKGRKLGTDASHTKAMRRSLVTALLKNNRIKTTETRAKEIRADVDRVITWAKAGDVHSRRLALGFIYDDDLVKKIFSEAERFEGRQGGYTRILKLGPRKGDAAPMVIMELID